MVTTSVLWIPLAVLGFCMLFVNGWKLWFQCNYGTRPLFFSAIYLGALVLAFWSQPFHLFPSDFIWVAAGAVGYIGFSWLWEIKLGRYVLPETSTFSVPQRDIAPPNRYSALPKLLEILLQDVALLALILLLMNHFASLVVVTLACVFVVAFTHAPAPRLFGRFYGWFFLVFGVGWAALMPYLVSNGHVWLGEIYAIHLAMYALMYLLALRRAARY